MRGVLHFFTTTLFLLAVFFTQVFCINVLPYPFNHIDVVFVALWWYICVPTDAHVWGKIVILGLTTELYSSSPFGITTCALFISLVIGRWLVLHIFTSHAWHVILFATFTTLVLYHGLFLVILIVHHSLYGIPWSLSGPFFASTAIGIALSTILMLIFYIAARLYNKRLRPNYTTLSL